MRTKRRSSVIFREEPFGSIVYVKERDDIFLLDKDKTKILTSTSSRWKKQDPSNQNSIINLAELGIIDAEINGGALSQRPYSGPHTIGNFEDIPVVNVPLLANCFSTSWCPLKCVYCHADDLMKEEYRINEYPESIERVAHTAAKLSALVYVITGGDPLTRPERALSLSKALREDVGIVLDTSGVGNVPDAKRILQSRPMHLRISIDSMDPRVNKITRPINKEIKNQIGLGRGESLDFAERLIDEASYLAQGLTVQTTISSKNDQYDHLYILRDWLVSRGVKNWVLHVAIRAGSALRFSSRSDAEKRKISQLDLKDQLTSKKSADIIPDREDAAKAIRRLIQETQRDGVNIDIRCTDANIAPNSVFLIGNDGDLFTQGVGSHHGKKVTISRFGDAPITTATLWSYVSQSHHVQRYINYLPAIHGPLKSPPY